MNQKEMEDKIIKDYQRDEHMMIHIFAQWCINHDLDPTEVYQRAYPNQSSNLPLQQVIDLTVPKAEAGDIPNQTLLNVLSLFGNDDLAFIVTEEINKQELKE